MSLYRGRYAALVSLLVALLAASPTLTTGWGFGSVPAAPRFAVVAAGSMRPGRGELLVGRMYVHCNTCFN